MLRKNPHSLPREAYGGAGKRLFIGLVVGSCALLCLFFLCMWLVPFLGLAEIHPKLPMILGMFVLLLVFCLLILCVVLVYQIYTGAQWPGRFGARGFVIRLLLPVMELLGRMVGIPKERIRLSFIKTNNELVLASGVRCKPDKLLVLLPHCLQQSLCPHRLHTDISRCVRCGKCSIGHILNAADKRGFVVSVASGGTLARRIVKQMRPELIVAVACERDLTSGIQDAYPIPVFGCLNERPCGPCLDTTVATATLCRVIDGFLSSPHGAA